MGKKRKKLAAAGPWETRTALDSKSGPADVSSAAGSLSEWVRHPMLWLAWVTLAISVFAIGAAIRFRNDMEMGAIREPTGMILWAAISITAFASHRRQMKRERSDNGRSK